MRARVHANAYADRPMRMLMFVAASAVAAVAAPPPARADQAAGSDGREPSHADHDADDGIDDDAYLLRHPHASWWLSAQANVIAQFQPGFHSPYAGANSFTPADHAAISTVETVYGAYQLTATTAVMVAGESVGGGGLSQALGIAGFTDVDVVRNPTLGPAPYIAKAVLEQIIPLSSERVTVSTAPWNVLRRVPARRLVLRGGKLATTDAFDVNAPGSDSHLQLMNWSLVNNGAYDYAADTRGYTLGATVEYITPLWALRYGAMLMPKVANGPDYDYDVATARGEQLELELHECIGGHAGIIRLLGFLNHAKMGNYAEAIAVVRQGILDTPDITATRVAGRTKHGVAVGWEQALAHDARAFGRIGWSDGENETFAYTEIDNSVAAGADIVGTAWSRPADRLGLAVVTNGLSRSHRDYLALGGLGFILGDGALRYGREDIVEAYYTARAYRGISPAVDIQVVEHPGYNTDRGPAVVGSLRLHVEL